MKDRRKELTERLAAIEKQLQNLYGETYRAVLQIKAVREAIEKGEDFTWDDNKAASKQMEKQLSRLAESSVTLIQDGIKAAWDTGEARTSETVKAKYSGVLKEEAAKISEQATAKQRKSGTDAHAFATREKGSMNLSRRVWNLTDCSRKELETIIQNGIIEGKSPHEVSRDLRKYLNNPEALFRRVRNPKTGDLELSKAAKKYHPGQGVYRSAYKNARRLAVTEMNAAYRRAQWESYQTNPLVTAYEIRLSANHTTTIKGKIVPLEDICDQLAGRYPKTFLWTGWHPHCRCDMIPVLLTEDDFKARIQARAKGKLGTWEKEYKKAHPDPTYPKGMTDWITDNADRIKKGEHLPEWVEDNRKAILLMSYAYKDSENL